MKNQFLRDADNELMLHYGYVEIDAEKDRYDNPVSLISMTNGYSYRMVSFPRKNLNVRQYAVYQAPGVYLRVEHRIGNGQQFLQIGGFSLSWDDAGNLLDTAMPEGLTAERKWFVALEWKRALSAPDHLVYFCTLAVLQVIGLHKTYWSVKTK